MPMTVSGYHFAMKRRQFIAAAGVAGLTGFLSNSANAKIQGLLIVGKDDWLFPIWDDVTHTDLKAIDTVCALFDTAIDVLAKAKIQTVMMVTPVKSRVLRDMMPDDVRYAPDVETRYDRLRAALGKNGTQVPDLAATLIALHKAQPSLPIFFKGDTHWTAAGAEAAAATVAKVIKEKIKLPPASGAGVAFAPAVGKLKQEKNDLSAMLQGPEKAKYKLEEYPIHTVAQNAGSLLEGDAPADVVVIGNSFTQPRLGFANMLSNQLGRPVTLHWKVHQFGPYFTLLDYLATPGFKAHKPALIVWDFHESDVIMGPEHKDSWGPSAMSSAEFLSKLHAALGV